MPVDPATVLLFCWYVGKTDMFTFWILRFLPPYSFVLVCLTLGLEYYSSSWIFEALLRSFLTVPGVSSCLSLIRSITPFCKTLCYSFIVKFVVICGGWNILLGTFSSLEILALWLIRKFDGSIESASRLYRISSLTKVGLGFSALTSSSSLLPIDWSSLGDESDAFSFVTVPFLKWKWVGPFFTTGYDPSPLALSGILNTLGNCVEFPFIWMALLNPLMRFIKPGWACDWRCVLLWDSGGVRVRCNSGEWSPIAPEL